MSTDRKQETKTVKAGNDQFIQDVIKVFADKTSCATQYNDCPCGTCFHSISDKVDFRHITWLILLGLRGDYEKNQKYLIRDIETELNAI